MESAKPKLTTDDCYTPENIYSVVRDYVAERYGLDPGAFVRPFYPGGDYQAEDYTGKVVVDNPPFSILRKIMNFYNENGIKWFLFTPGMSTVIGTNYREKMHICLGAAITYENGATVRTSFATNLEPAGIRTDPDLLNAINAANEENRQKTKKIKNMISWNYPPQLLTAAKMNYLAKYGIDISFSLDDLFQSTHPTRGCDLRRNRIEPQGKYFNPRTPRGGATAICCSLISRVTTCCRPNITPLLDVVRFLNYCTNLLLFLGEPPRLFRTASGSPMSLHY